MDLSIKDLLSTLKPNFKSSDITLLEMVLLSREEKIRREKEEVESDLKLEKSKSKQLEEKISVLENDYKSVCENEKKAQKRFTSVSNMVSEIMKDKVAAEDENRKLEKDKVAAEDENRKLEKENEILKRRFLDWEIRVGQLEEEASKLTRKESELSAKLNGKKDGAANASAVAVDSSSHSIVEQSGGLHLKSTGNLANKEQGTGPSCTTSKPGSEVRKQTAAGEPQGRNGIRHMECDPSASRHTVKRVRKLVLLSESEDEDEDDNIPISRFQNKES